jgi:hypothetical protein
MRIPLKGGCALFARTLPNNVRGCSCSSYLFASSRCSRLPLGSTPFNTGGIMKTKQLARALLRQPTPAPDSKAQPCFACGRSFIRGDRRFCGSNCRRAFDAGFPPFQGFEAPYDLPLGKNGFRIDCKGCGKNFDSKGLRCCSEDCEREFRRKQELERELKTAPFRVAKRKCIECGRPIKRWQNGRRVSNAQKFCATPCQQKHARNRRMGSGTPTGILNGESAKKCPKTRGSSGRVKIASLPAGRPIIAQTATAPRKGS